MSTSLGQNLLGNRTEDERYRTCKVTEQKMKGTEPVWLQNRTCKVQKGTVKAHLRCLGIGGGH